MSATGILARQLAGWDLQLGADEFGALVEYARLLSRYDRANVIGTRDFDRVVVEHVLDSVSCLLFGPLWQARRIADVGSGGGLPGIPLAITMPKAHVELFESTGKKAAFLRHAVSELGLQNVGVDNSRVEEAARQAGHRAAYDICTARAVARLSVVAEYCLPLARVGGHVISMKGREDPDEWEEGRRAAYLLGGEIEDVIQVPLLPELEQRERRLVVLRKLAETPQEYPRATGTPARRPLGASRRTG